MYPFSTLQATRILLRPCPRFFGRSQTKDNVPKRTDLGELPDYRTYKHILFGKQEGVCGGCRSTFQFRNFTVDHIVPKIKGGTNHQDNLQLLCGACNSLKGDRPQAYLVARLKGLATP